MATRRKTDLEKLAAPAKAPRKAKAKKPVESIQLPRYRPLKVKSAKMILTSTSTRTLLARLPYLRLDDAARRKESAEQFHAALFASHAAKVAARAGAGPA